MAAPRVPAEGEDLELPCGETVSVTAFDLGMREFACECGETHAVVMDPHPLARFVPEATVEALKAAVEPGDDLDAFGTVHVMGMVREEYPDRVVSSDVSEDGRLGCAMLWVSDFDARRLHEVVVELLVELMDHAVSHADDEDARSSFQTQLSEFDVEAFVDEYRRERDLTRRGDDPA